MNAAVDGALRRLDEVVSLIQRARAMPMSASCVINRQEVLALLDEARAALPPEFGQVRALMRDRESLIEEGREEAEAILAEAYEERAALVSETEIVRAARAEHDRLLAEAAQQSAQMRREVDDYIDAKLAGFEIVLNKTLTSVERGRAKLRDRMSDEVFEAPDATPLPQFD